MGRPASRAALLFVGAAAAAGCGSQVATPSDGGPRDAASEEQAGDGSPVGEGGAVDGPGIVDTGAPQPDSGADGAPDGASDGATDAFVPNDGNGVPIYGAAPFDAGRHVFTRDD
jgi:hypothetical protein